MSTTRYQVTYVIEVPDKYEAVPLPGGGMESTFGLIRFTRDCPPTWHNASKRELAHAEKNNYKVISCGTRPLPAPGDYMRPAIARGEHQTQGTADVERVTYSVPADCMGWMETLLMRQGYGAIPNEEDGGLLVVTRTEEADYCLAQVEAETARVAAEMEEV
jgi:hypothetical protein